MSDENIMQNKRILLNIENTIELPSAKELDEILIVFGNENPFMDDIRCKLIEKYRDIILNFRRDDYPQV